MDTKMKLMSLMVLQERIIIIKMSTIKNLILVFKE
uniref:Uncharacterized protein n=1 Tax=viral metagenome TaxID=1070528 RepID=A0A6C0K426_9ZZZZ